MTRGFGLAVLLAAGPAAGADTYIQFHSPTGNIQCEIMNDPSVWVGARCDIMEVAVQSFVKPPADCDGDWGHAFEVQAHGPGVPDCVTDTVANPDGPVLPYGGSISFGPITCLSEQTGMTCRNREGHGFTLARKAQRVF